jgi:TM2 domain-containing membrane protein YozV
MNKLFLLFIHISLVIQAQSLNELHSPVYIREFADHLFFEKDYLRSIYEYEKLLKYLHNDTIEFKVALAYQTIKRYDLALEKFRKINKESIFFNMSEIEYYKTLLISGRYEKLQTTLINKEENFQRLLYLSYLFTYDKLPDQQQFVSSFPVNQQESILNFYNQKKDPPYKSSFLSGLMSSIIPGSGKIYLGELGDGITAFLAASIFAFLSYDNFSHNHKFRGWLFSGIGFFFYAGNIYGSVSSAQIYNARVDYEYNLKLKEYLQNKNYFLPGNDFIK